jgi:hypothetical protein
MVDQDLVFGQAIVDDFGRHCGIIRAMGSHNKRVDYHAFIEM